MDRTLENAAHQSNSADRLADFLMLAQRSFLLDLSSELNRGSVSYAQFFLLGFLANEKHLTMTDIANKMGHSTAAATGLVDRLEKLGYVERVHAAEDRRKVMVQITKKGQQMVSRLRDVIASSIAKTMAGSAQATEDANALGQELQSLLPS